MANEPQNKLRWRGGDNYQADKEIKHSATCSIYLPMDRTCDCGAIRISSVAGKPNEPQKDLVIEAREFLPEVTQERKSALCKAVTHKVVLAKAEWLIQQLCNEVERLREQWNTRFNTLCGLCGKRYLGPRDEHLHGYGRCDKKVDHD